jgi:hypothetical protein
MTHKSHAPFRFGKFLPGFDRFTMPQFRRFSKTVKLIFSGRWNGFPEQLLGRKKSLNPAQEFHILCPRQQRPGGDEQNRKRVVLLYAHSRRKEYIH